ncbi:MAG TPA: methyltransferase domain-containing protein [Propionibacteriaceae bacterium]|jgi:SAM-dependent methyltransferase|nr:methyltransferase domain-containing protein [Propionibacteriaceae bacterium]
MNPRQRDVPPADIPRYIWLLSRYPNLLASFTHPLREAAANRLCLEPGNRVLDVGCGTGPSFPFLVQAVGPDGEVVGVEISPDLAAIAKKRIEQEEWNNIRVAVGPAQTIALPGTYDGLLLFAAHEVLTSPEALDHLLANLNKGSWIVAFGAKLSNSRRGRLLNPLLRLLTQTLLPASSAPVDARPWRFLEDRTDKLHVEERMAGLFYLAAGCLR